MNTSKALLLILPLIPLLGCRPPLIDDEEDTETQDLLTEACDGFCLRATACSVEIAQQWGFQTQAECEGRCREQTEVATVIEGREYCHDIYVDFWECGSQIQTCEEFIDFEDSSFGGEGPADHACKAEGFALLEGFCT